MANKVFGGTRFRLQTAYFRLETFGGKKLIKRLDGWKGGTLSLGGRITLLNACLSSIPLYNMSMYLLPKSVVRKIDVIRKKVLLVGKYPEKEISFDEMD